jgi:hypothetical protein
MAKHSFLVVKMQLVENSFSKTHAPFTSEEAEAMQEISFPKSIRKFVSRLYSEDNLLHLACVTKEA